VELSEGPAYGRRILESVAWGWGVASATAVLLAAVVGWFASRQITQPLSSLIQVTDRMAEGHLAARAQVGRADELGSLARSFNRMAAQVEETVSTLRQFVADAAHELHTPLTALRTNLDLAPDDEFVRRAQVQVGRLEAMTEGLLDLSCIEAERQAHAFSPVVLNALAQDAAELYASQAEQAGLGFGLAMPRDLIVVTGDAAQLRAALGNLLDNAIKFTPEGGTVDISLTQEGDWAMLCIRDTGIGIPARDVPRVFDRFHRGSNAAAYPGSGLGLAIVKAVVTRHSGTIEVASVSPGTRLVLRLPLRV